METIAWWSNETGDWLASQWWFYAVLFLASFALGLVNQYLIHRFRR